MSPGTTSGAGICCTDPSRTTLTIGVCIFARASTALRAWGKQRLAPAKVPVRFELVDDLPRNAMGKVTKPAVVERLLAES